jgi:transposase InsO family protein
MEQRGVLVQHQQAPADLSEASQLISLPAKQQEHFRYRLKYIEECNKVLKGRLPKDATKALIGRIADKIGDLHAPSVSTLWRWTHNYRMSNRNPFSLLKRYGSKRVKRTSHLVEELITHYITTSYLQRECPTVMHSYKLLKSHITVENNRRTNLGNLDLEIPSYATFRRRILAMDRFLVIRKRQGLKAAQRLHKFGGHLYVDNDLNANVQYDTLTMNVNVIDGQGNCIGRPILSALFNPACRECPGYDIDIGAPCAEKTIRAAIRAIIRDGKYASVTTDHGVEVFNNWVQNTFNTLGIVIDYVPVGDPDAKAFIERFFGTVNTSFCNNLPGTTKSNHLTLGDYPSKDRACMTLDELRSAFDAWLEVYHNTYHEGLGTSPAKKREELEKLSPPAERYSTDDLQQLCLSTWRLRISRGRVQSKHLFWTGPGLPEVAERLSAHQKAFVYFNPCDLGTVWVAHPDTPKIWHPAYATRSDYQNGLTLSDHERVLQVFKDEKRDFDGSKACQKMYELNQLIESYKSKSHKEKTAQKKPTSPSLPSQNPRTIFDSTDYPTFFLKSDSNEQ